MKCSKRKGKEGPVGRSVPRTSTSVRLPSDLVFSSHHPPCLLSPPHSGPLEQLGQHTHSRTQSRATGTQSPRNVAKLKDKVVNHDPARS